MVRVKRVKAVSVVELAPFEDEGPGYVFDQVVRSVLL